MLMRPARIIAAKRDREILSDAQIQAFVRGLVDESWSEGQVAALAMAILLNGMSREETACLTRAMTHSGPVLDWADADFSGPVLDKHSTGGVGDKVSLLLAPIMAACGGVVPMISGRGLAHTGGTLDKLESIPGYDVAPSRDQCLSVLKTAGCVIIGASAELAPADRRLYAIRDVTATVESIPLITASILSKKLAAGLQGLVMDIKLGNGAFMRQLGDARALANSLVDVAGEAGLPCRALITDMNQVLGHSVGNALEVAECLSFLLGAHRDPRLLEVTLALAAQLLELGGLAVNPGDGYVRALDALESGRAAESFARMVAGLGGPADVLSKPALPVAPVQRDLLAPVDGVIVAMDTQRLGLAVLGLGGGRRHVGDAVDGRVGLTGVLPVGARVQVGQPLLRVHAASPSQAQQALDEALAAITLDEDRGQGEVLALAPVLIEVIRRT
jgi:thymidine phosphorylase